jgi:tetratricopeptide (TPR) repeat protein
MFRLARPFRSLVRRIAAARWTRRGRRCLARGDLPGATSALERALELRPRAFEALLHLTRAYLRRREYGLAWSTIREARRSDSTRFAREAPRWLAREGVHLEAVRQMASPAREPQTAAASAEPRARRTAAALAYGDCRDLDEYARFRAMPPISRAEVEDTDWESVLDDLLDD